MSVSLIIKNASIQTMDPANPVAQAIAIDVDLIAKIGSDEEILELADINTIIIDAKQRSLLPGFIENHLHFVTGGLELSHLQLTQITGFNQLKSALIAYASENLNAKILTGFGATYDIIGRPLTRQDLDTIISDRPVMLMAADHHTVWANTKALTDAGILQGDNLNEGVVIGSDGLATGELREAAAFLPVVRLDDDIHFQTSRATGAEPPLRSKKQRESDKEKILAGLHYCASFGITSLMNMDGTYYIAELCQELYDEGRIPVRVDIPFCFKPSMKIDELQRAIDMKRDFHSSCVRSNHVKMFMDGVAENKTAYMLGDQNGAFAKTGGPLYDIEYFKQVCTKIDQLGLQITTHAIGDGAVRAVIDGYEAAQHANNNNDTRHRIEHIELINRNDIPRMAALNIIASVQPAHVLGALDFSAHEMDKVFDKKRWQDLFLVKSLADAGVKIAFSSDWPIADVNVARSLQAHLCRKAYDGAKDERLTRDQALYAYTAGAAYAACCENYTGTLKRGLAADLVLYDGKLDQISDAEIGKLKVALTIAGGKITYKNTEANLL